MPDCRIHWGGDVECPHIAGPSADVGPVCIRPQLRLDFEGSIHRVQLPLPLWHQTAIAVVAHHQA